MDPIIEIHPRAGQINNLIQEIQETTEKGFRTLVTVLTKKMAEEKSGKLIASYHFLVSVHFETHEATKDAYIATTTEASIDDFEFKSEILRVVFPDGNEYEYYGVPKAIYVKLVNADTPDRFARRHIYENYLYRSTSKIVGGNE